MDFGRYIQEKGLIDNTEFLNIFLVLEESRPGAIVEVKNLDSLMKFFPSWLKFLKYSYQDLYLIYDGRKFNESYALDDNNTGEILGYGQDCYDNINGKYGVSFRTTNGVELFGWRCFKSPKKTYINLLLKKINKSLKKLELESTFHIEKRLDIDEIKKLIEERRFEEAFEGSQTLNNHILMYGGFLDFYKKISQYNTKNKFIKFMEKNSEVILQILIFCSETKLDIFNELAELRGEEDFDNERYKIMNEYSKEICKRLLKMLV